MTEKQFEAGSLALTPQEEAYLSFYKRMHIGNWQRLVAKQWRVSDDGFTWPRDCVKVEDPTPELMITDKLRVFKR